MRQQFLLKVLSKQHMRRSHETPILENIRRAPCTADEEDIPLDEAARQAFHAYDNVQYIRNVC